MRSCHIPGPFLAWGVLCAAALAASSSSATAGIMYGSSSALPGASFFFEVRDFATPTPTVNVIGSMGDYIGDIAVSASGVVYAVQSPTPSSIYTVNPVTGALQAPVISGYASGQNSLAWATGDILYSYGFMSGEVRKIEIATRTVSILTVLPANGADLAWDPTDGSLYAAGLNNGLYKINPSNGTFTLQGILNLGGPFASIAIDDTGQMYATTALDLSPVFRYYSVNKATAQTTFVADFTSLGIGTLGLGASPVGGGVVPEPATVTLLSSGILGLLACRVLRKRAENSVSQHHFDPAAGSGKGDRGKPGVSSVLGKTRCQFSFRLPSRLARWKLSRGENPGGKTRCQFSFRLPSRLARWKLSRMGRPLRPTDDGLIYHAINRGNDRRVVFTDDEDHRAFLHSLGRTQLRYPFRLYGYCLMSNHFHMLIRPEPGVTISRILQSLTVAHTWRFHRRHRSTGHVWQGRFKSPVIQDDGHLWAVLRYIEANPLRAKMVVDPADHCWSSYPAHGLGLVDPLLSPLPEWSDLGPDEPSRRAAWRRKVMADQPEAEVDAIRRSLRQGTPLGDPDWVESMAAQLGRPIERRPPGRPRKVKT